MNHELPVLRDCYTLTLELSRRVEKFPRHQRMSLGMELTSRVRAILGCLVSARYSSPSEKAAHLIAANLELEQLRFGLRLAVDLKALPFAGHGHLIELAHKVGAQVGGWLKIARARQGGSP